MAHAALSFLLLKLHFKHLFPGILSAPNRIMLKVVCQSTKGKDYNAHLKKIRKVMNKQIIHKTGTSDYSLGKNRCRFNFL